MDLELATLKLRIKLSNTFSLTMKLLENNRKQSHVNCFTMRKDKRTLARNCSVSPGVSPRVDGRYLRRYLRELVSPPNS
jgi:hypothetical protein